MQESTNFSQTFLICSAAKATQMHLELECLSLTAPNLVPAALSRQAKLSQTRARALEHQQGAQELDESEVQSEYPSRLSGGRFHRSPTGTSATSSVVDLSVDVSLPSQTVDVLRFPVNPFCLLNDVTDTRRVTKRDRVGFHAVLPYFLHKYERKKKKKNEH